LNGNSEKTATSNFTHISIGPPLFCTYNLNTTFNIAITMARKQFYVVPYAVRPPTGRATIRYYRQLIVGRDSDLEWEIPLSALAFAYRSVSDNSSLTITLLSNASYDFAFVDGVD
jgi:hypothetical protein